MKTKIGVDADCVELARKFLVDEQTRNSVSDTAVTRAIQSLSEHIQTAVEDWFEAQNWELDLAEGGVALLADAGGETP